MASSLGHSFLWTLLLIFIAWPVAGLLAIVWLFLLVRLTTGEVDANDDNIRIYFISNVYLLLSFYSSIVISSRRYL